MKSRSSHLSGTMRCRSTELRQSHRKPICYIAGMNRFLKLCASITILLLIGLWFAHVMWILVGHDAAERPQSMVSVNLEQRNPFAMKRMCGESSVVVLLQQSQVQTSKQLHRLIGIDQGWARWANSMSHCVDVDIIAAVPDNSVQTDDLRILGSVKMFPSVWTRPDDPASTSVTSSPYHQLVRSLFAVLSHSCRYSPIQWIVLANDHTFIIPQNLVAHLATLDSEQLIYTGNQLALSYRKQVLSFASGGAGAVLSHPVAKLILVIWMLISEDKMLLSLLDEYSADKKVIHISDAFGIHWGNNRTKNDTSLSCYVILERATCRPGKSGDDAQKIVLDVSVASRADIGCVLHAMRQWLHEAHSKNTFVSRICANMPWSDHFQVRLILSNSVHLLVTATRQVNEHQSDLSVSVVRKPMHGGETVMTATAAQLRRECSAPDKWAKTNPGIILINCLSRLFKVEFTQSVSKELIIDPSIGPAATHTAELFNVYGALRTLYGEYDEWYGEAKQLVASSSNGNNSASDSSKVQLVPSALAKDVISFHYVSTVEAQLLYRILDAQLRSPLTTSLRRHVITALGNASTLPVLCTGYKSSSPVTTTSLPCLSAQDLLAMWPRTDENVGHYSRPLAKGAAGEKQAAVLHAYLSQIQIQQPRC